MTDKSTESASSGVNFATLVLGLSSAALYYLGEEVAVGKGGQGAEKNVELARQNIDFLEVLAEKTKGNLSGEEKELLDGVLKDLRLKFVDACK